MNAIFFLWKRSVLNGLKRSFTSPKRLVSLVFFVCYLIFAIIRPILFAQSMDPHFMQQHSSVSLSAAQNVSFAVMLAFTCFGVLTMGTYNRTLRAADIEMLFPTPIESKIVLAARMTRDIFASFSFPIFIGIMYFLTARHVSTSEYISLYRTGFLAWILLSICFSAWGYAYNLRFSRSDATSDKTEKIAGYSLLTFALLPWIYLGIRLRGQFSMGTGVSALQETWVKIFYFPAVFGSAFTTIPKTGLAGLEFGGIGLLAFGGLGFYFAFAQKDWFYDVASTKSVNQLQNAEMMRSNDFSGILQARVKSGKFKIKGSSRLMKMRVQGIYSAVWREFVLLPRRLRSGSSLLFLIAVGYSVFPIFLIPIKSAEDVKIAGALMIGTQSLGIFILTNMQSRFGISTYLQQVDMIKPLPFSSAKLILMEIFSRSWFSAVIIPISSLIVTIYKPELFPYALSCLLFTPTLATAMISAAMLSSLLFPDIGDPTQRGFRNLVQLLGLVIAAAPGGAIIIVAAISGEVVIPAAFLATGVNVLMTCLFTFFDGKLFENFVPGD